MDAKDSDDQRCEAVPVWIGVAHQPFELIRAHAHAPPARLTCAGTGNFSPRSRGSLTLEARLQTSWQLGPQLGHKMLPERLRHAEPRKHAARGSRSCDVLHICAQGYANNNSSAAAAVGPCGWLASAPKRPRTRTRLSSARVVIRSTLPGRTASVTSRRAAMASSNDCGMRINKRFPSKKPLLRHAGPNPSIACDVRGGSLPTEAPSFRVYTW